MVNIEGINLQSTQFAPFFLGGGVRWGVGEVGWESGEYHCYSELTLDARVIEGDIVN